MFEKIERALLYSFDNERLMIEAWGENAVRIRATKYKDFPKDNWALLDRIFDESDIVICEESAELINGKIAVKISKYGKLEIYKKDGRKILEEYSRNRKSVTDPKCSALEIEAREFKPILGSDSYHLTVRFESLDKDEKDSINSLIWI